MKTAVIIIPTYNEVESIQRTLEALEPILDASRGWRLQILVVDDSSPDGTARLVRQLQKRMSALHLLLNPEKAGLGAAYLRGMSYAFEKLKAELIFEFDADLSHPPAAIPRFLALIDQGADLVIGTRYSEGGSIPADWGWHRKLLSRGGNLVIGLVFLNKRVRDWTSGFRAITKPVYEQVAPQLESAKFKGYTFQVGFLYTALQAGFKLAQVPYHFRDRDRGHSKIGAEYIVNTLMYIFQLRLNTLFNHRLFKFALVGGVGGVVQFVSLAIFRQHLLYVLAYFLAAQLAVISNFVFSNLWTFNDRTLTWRQLPFKFLLFNLASFGSVAIQTLLAWLGARLIGEDLVLFTVPLSEQLLGYPFAFDTGFLFMITGILVGMIWNFTAYSKIIWRQGRV